MTVFTSYLHTSYTWNHKENKRIGFINEDDAKYAVYCAVRRQRRLRFKRINNFICAESSNNPTIAVENYDTTNKEQPTERANKV